MWILRLSKSSLINSNIEQCIRSSWPLRAACHEQACKRSCEEVSDNNRHRRPHTRCKEEGINRWPKTYEVEFQTCFPHKLYYICGGYAHKVVKEIESPMRLYALNSSSFGQTQLRSDDVSCKFLGSRCRPRVCSDKDLQCPKSGPVPRVGLSQERACPKSGPVPRACPKSGPVPRVGLSQSMVCRCGNESFQTSTISMSSLTACTTSR